MRTDAGAELTAAPARKQMLRISFRSLAGDAPTVMLASCLRICTDGTLRGADNCVVAHAIDGCWKVGGKLHRELECAGPVNLRLVMPGQDAPVRMGPFARLHTGAGLFYGDGACLDIVVPGRNPRRAGDCLQLTLIRDGANDGKD
jgi:hypothetical protein